MSLRQLLAVIVAVVAASVGANNSLAQTNTGEIQGLVTDPTGAVLPGANVVVVHVASGLRIEHVSDSKGRFFIPALPVGEYTIAVVLDGFKAVTRSGLISASRSAP
jgi:hypothetical protein